MLFISKVFCSLYVCICGQTVTRPMFVFCYEKRFANRLNLSTHVTARVSYDFYFFFFFWVIGVEGRKCVNIFFYYIGRSRVGKWNAETIPCLLKKLVVILSGIKK